MFKLDVEPQKPFLAKNNYWHISRYADCKLVLNEENSSKDFYKWLSEDPKLQPLGWLDSARYKEVLKKQQGLPSRSGFIDEDNPHRVETIKPILSLVAPEKIEKLTLSLRRRVNDIVTKNLNNPDFDAMKDLIRPICIEYLAEALDLPEIYEVKEQYFDMVELAFTHNMQYEWINPFTDEQLEKYAEATDFFARLMGQIIMNRLGKDGDDFAYRLLKAYGDDFIRVGTNLTISSTALHGAIAAMRALTSRLVEEKEVQNKLRAIDSFTNNNLDEAIRFGNKRPLLFRILKQDITIDNVLMKAGMVAMVDINGAAFDPEVYPEPFVLDFNRDPIPSMTYGYGIHGCIGRVLSRSLITALYEELLDNTFDIVPVGEIEYEKDRQMGIPLSIPILLMG